MTASSSAASDFPPEEPTADRMPVREISSEEGNRLPRIVRRDSGSVVSRRRPQIVAAVRVLGAGVTRGQRGQRGSAALGVEPAVEHHRAGERAGHRQPAPVVRRRRGRLGPGRVGVRPQVGQHRPQPGRIGVPGGFHQHRLQRAQLVRRQLRGGRGQPPGVGVGEVPGGQGVGGDRQVIGQHPGGAHPLAGLAGGESAGPAQPGRGGHRPGHPGRPAAVEDHQPAGELRLQSGDRDSQPHQVGGQGLVR